MLRFSLRALVLIAACASPVRAQVGGTVTEPRGQPLASVTVELWTATGRAAVAVTDRRGRFRFTAEQARAANGLSLMRIGYREQSLRVAPGDTALHVVMRVQPIALPELTVTPAREPCPNVEEAGARALWRAARRRYAPTTAARGIAARMLTAEERLVPAYRVGWIDEARLHPRAVWYVGATPVPKNGRYLNINVWIAEHGYGWRTGLDRPVWEFPALEARHAHHFASEVFGARHTLSLYQEDTSRVVLAFCPRDHERPWIAGTLVLARDSTFISARWRFGTPEPHVDAGGTVSFIRPVDARSGLPHLLPARGTFWRAHWKFPDRYDQRATVFLEWTVSATDSMPDPDH